MLNYILSKNCLQLKESYMVECPLEMEDILNYIIDTNKSIDSFIHNYSINRMIDEWKSHNLCYELGILPSRTADVNLTPNSFIMKIIYYIAAKIYDILY